MRTDLDKFFRKKYDIMNYNCSHFLAEVWQYMTGQDITEALKGFMHPPKDRTVPAAMRHHWKKLDKPVSPCVVLFFRKGYPPHVGLYFKRKVLHLSQLGVQYVPVDVAGFGFATTKYYSC